MDVAALIVGIVAALGAAGAWFAAHRANAVAQAANDLAADANVLTEKAVAEASRSNELAEAAQRRLLEQEDKVDPVLWELIVQEDQSAVLARNVTGDKTAHGAVLTVALRNLDSKLMEGRSDGPEEVFPRAVLAVPLDDGFLREVKSEGEEERFLMQATVTWVSNLGAELKHAFEMQTLWL